MLRIRTATAALTGLLAALALAGCGDDEPTAAPPAETSSTATASAPTEATSSATPTETAPPTEAPPGETAREFIERWVELGNYMLTSGDSAPYREVVGPDCTPCQETADLVDRIYEQNGTIEGGAERVLRMDPETTTQWIVVRRVQVTRYKESAGDPITELEGGKYPTRLYLAKVRGNWVVGHAEGIAS